MTIRDRVPTPVRRAWHIVPQGVRRRLRKAEPRPWHKEFRWDPPKVGPELVVAPPDFIGLGMGRSGTTWWWRLVNKHPRVYNHQGLHKERQYLRHHYLWDPPTAASVDDYAAWFPRPPGMLTGEWTPWYLTHPWIGEAINVLAPDAKLLVIIRDPVERYISGMTLDAPRSLRKPGGDLFHFNCGMYHRMLRTLEQHVDRERVLLLQYERCVADPGAELDRTYEFLGLEPHHPDNIALPVNVSRQPKPVLDPRRRAVLVDAYEADVAALVADYPEIDRALWPNFA